MGDRLDRPDLHGPDANMRLPTFCALILFSSTPLWSATYVSTLALPPQSFSEVYDDGLTYDQWGMPFTTGSDSYTLDAITASLRLNGGSASALTASLYLADGNYLPTGAALGVTFSFGAISGSDFGAVDFTPDGSFVLAADTGYVFVLSVDPVASVSWQDTTDSGYSATGGWTLPDPSVMAYRTNQFGFPVWGNGGGGTYHFKGAVSATVVAVPEPGASAVLAGFGALGAGLGLRRRRRSV